MKPISASAAFQPVDRLLGPEHAVLVNGFDGHRLASSLILAPTWPDGFRIAWMAGNTRFVTWNGKDLPRRLSRTVRGRAVDAERAR